MTERAPLMSDASTTVGSVLVTKLVARAREGDAEAVNRVCDLVAGAIEQPGQRVGTAVRLKPRGGRAPSRADRLSERDAALRELTELQPGQRRNARIRAARQKLSRYAANGWPHERGNPEDTGNRERDLMRTIMRTGLSVPGERQHRGIVSDHNKNI
jgi:hypothetical protein